MAKALLCYDKKKIYKKKWWFTKANALDKSQELQHSNNSDPLTYYNILDMANRPR